MHVVTVYVLRWWGCEERSAGMEDRVLCFHPAEVLRGGLTYLRSPVLRAMIFQNKPYKLISAWTCSATNSILECATKGQDTRQNTLRHSMLFQSPSRHLLGMRPANTLHHHSLDLNLECVASCAEKIALKQIGVRDLSTCTVCL